LQPTDRFNLIAFGSAPHAFFSTLQPAQADAVTHARFLAARLAADQGGTEIGAALQLAYRQRQPERPLDLLLITDGEVWGVEPLIAEAHAAGNRIFTVGVGAAVAEGLVRGLADATGGASEFVHPHEDMAARIVRHFERIRAPRAAATVHWPAHPTRQTPPRLPPVFSGDTLHLWAALPAPPTDPVTLTLTAAAGAPWTQTVTLAPWPVKETADTLARLAAARRLAGLADEEAAALAVQHQLVSPQTHFLMVDAHVATDPAGERPALRRVPHRLAAGWQGLGSVSDRITLDHPLTGDRPLIDVERPWGQRPSGLNGIALARERLVIDVHRSPSRTSASLPPMAESETTPSPDRGGRRGASFLHRVKTGSGAWARRLWRGIVGSVFWLGRRCSGFSRRLPTVWRTRWTHKPRQIHWNRKTP
jgi:hypothetical protein